MKPRYESARAASPGSYAFEAVFDDGIKLADPVGRVLQTDRINFLLTPVPDEPMLVGAWIDMKEVKRAKAPANELWPIRNFDVFGDSDEYMRVPRWMREIVYSYMSQEGFQGGPIFGE